MKKLLSISLILAAALGAHAQRWVPVMAGKTNGVLGSPTNFLRANIFGGGTVSVIPTNANGQLLIVGTGGGGGSATNGTNFQVFSSSATNVPVVINGPASASTNLFEVRDSSGNILGRIGTNGFYQSQYDYFPTFQSTDNTTNTLVSITIPNNSAARIVASVVAWNSTSTASYGRICTFKNNGGTVTQIGATGTLALVEEDATYECLQDISGTTVRVRVAGNTSRTVDWRGYVTVYPAP